MLKRVLKASRYPLLLLAVWLVFECYISWAAFCNQISSNDATNYSDDKYSCMFKGPIFSAVKIAYGWWQSTFEKTDSYIALFTFVAAVATFLLWTSTRDLVKDAEKTAERQLRAYVVMSEFKTDSIPAQDSLVPRPLFFFVWKNAGQTTRKMVSSINWKLFKKIPKKFNFPNNRNFPPTTAILGPDQTVSATPGSLNFEALDAVANGRGQILIWGWAEYNDVFPGTERHRTEFCISLIVRGDPRKSNCFYGSPKYSKHNGADEDCTKPVSTTG